MDDVLSNPMEFLTGIAVGFLLGFTLYWVTRSKKGEAQPVTLANNPEKERWFTLQLQAYERVILFLERITPQHLVNREKPRAKGVKAYYLQLVQSIQSEYEHNLTQQLYLPEKSWERVEIVKNQIANTLSQTQQKNEDIQRFREAIITDSLAQNPPVKALIKDLKLELKKSVLPHLRD